MGYKGWHFSCNQERDPYLLFLYLSRLRGRGKEVKGIKPVVLEGKRVEGNG